MANKLETISKLEAYKAILVTNHKDTIEINKLLVFASKINVLDAVKQKDIDCHELLVELLLKKVI